MYVMKKLQSNIFVDIHIIIRQQNPYLYFIKYSEAMSYKDTWQLLFDILFRILN